MRKRKKRSASAVPVMATQLMMASWETIYHRCLMMAQGTCTALEYQRMVAEKVAALQAASLALLCGDGNAAVMAPYLNRARANARRLRRNS